MEGETQTTHRQYTDNERERDTQTMYRQEEKKRVLGTVVATLMQWQGVHFRVVNTDCNQLDLQVIL